ncbi:hypothetical protein NL676_005003 [Syzygium grande]|nr:hypothetical protein NL676_005003 [Syzygium grande]
MNLILALQQKVASLTKPAIASTVDSLLDEGFFPCELLNVADLGCASGPSVVTFMSTVIESVQEKCAHSSCPLPEFQSYLNDLPGNDFNTLFNSLSNFSRSYESLSCFIMGASGSFHGRLFPRNCVHLTHSSYSVHWLSQSRCEEMVDDGRLVLVLHGRKDKDFASLDSLDMWGKLGEAIADLVSEGFIAEEKLDALNVPYYTAFSEEFQGIVDEEGSFRIKHMETIEVEAGGTTPDKDLHSRGRKMARHARSYTGSVISHHLGEEIMDKLYGEKLPIILGDDLANESRGMGVSIIVVLKKHAPLTQ